MGRRLGQHFLVDGDVAARIAAATEVQPDEPLLEIGGGRGELTRHLTGRAARFVVVELDARLAGGLRERFGDDIEVLPDDVVGVSFAELAADRRWVVVGNLPYYHTSAILLWLCEQSSLLSRAVVMLQAEVAARLAAPAGTKAYGRLTLAVAYRAEVESLFEVDPGAFRPPPQVQSMVIRLTFRREPPVSVADEVLLFELIEHGFRWRRKTLENCLTRWLPGGRETATAALAEAGIDPRRRAETLDLAEFAALGDAIGEVRGGVIEGGGKGQVRR